MAVASLRDIGGPVLDPRIRVRAGPWESQVMHLHQAGWQFQVQSHEYDLNRVITIYNRSSGVYGAFRTPRIDHECHVVGYLDTLYFPQEVVLSADVGMVREMYVPRCDFVDASVGYPMDMPSMVRPDSEFVIYRPEEKEDAKPEDLILTLDQVGEALRQIRELQKPQAIEMARQQRIRDASTEIQARILSVA